MTLVLHSVCVSSSCNLKIYPLIRLGGDHLADPPDGQDVAEDHVPHDAVYELLSLLLLLVEEDEAVEL